MNNGRGLARASLTIVALAIVLGFYGWTVADPLGRIWWPGPKFDYYNLLVDAFQAGHLHLGVDPTETPQLHDASLYRGRYYLYFGIAPALLLMLPVALLTGHDMPEPLAAAVFASTALVLGAVWFAQLRRRYFPNLPTGVWVVALFMLGLASIASAMLRRPQFYEIAAGCGYTAITGLMLALTKAVSYPERAVKWLAVAGTCAAIAAASRPNLLVAAAVVLPAVVVWIWRSERPSLPRRMRRLVTLTGAAGAPAALGLMVLVVYNYARFGDGFEFGANYQIGGNPHGMLFRAEFLWHNFRLYYLTPPRLGWFFPFVAPGYEPPQPENYWGPEDAHGQFVLLPLLVAAAGWGVWRWKRISPTPESRPLVVLCFVLLAFWSINLVITASTGWRANRYMLDFHPWLLVLCVLALWDCATAGQRWTRPVVFVATVWLYLVCTYNVLISFEVHGRLRDIAPERFERLSRYAHRVVWPLHRMFDPVFGARAFDVVFPRGRPGVIEPLITTVVPDEGDALYIRYLDADRAQLVLDSPPHGLIEGAPFELRPGETRRLEIALGSLLPPIDHPWYADLPRDQQLRLLTQAAVAVDDQLAFDAQAPPNPTAPNLLRIGRRTLPGLGEEQFSGQLSPAGGSGIGRVRLAQRGAEHGAVVIRTLLPRDRPGVSEPLLVLGTRERFELIRATYLDGATLRIGHEHGGDGFLTESPSFSVDYSTAHEVRIECSSLVPQESGSPSLRGLRVWFDGRLVVGRQFEPHPSTPHQVFIGFVPWPLGTSRRMYGGRLIESWRDDRAEVAPAAELEKHGRVRLLVLLPKTRIGRSEPLVTSGRAGAGDGVYVRYHDSDHIVIGFDHWGGGGQETALLRVDYDQPQVLMIAGGFGLESNDPRAAELRIWLNDKEVLVRSTQFHPAAPGEIWLGRNPIGLSTAEPVFTGAMAVLASEQQ